MQHLLQRLSAQGFDAGGDEILGRRIHVADAAFAVDEHDGGGEHVQPG